MLLLKKLILIMIIFCNTSVEAGLPSPDDAIDHTSDILSRYLLLLTDISINGATFDSTGNEALIGNLKKLIEPHEESQADTFSEEEIQGLFNSHEITEYYNLSSLFSQSTKTNKQTIFSNHSISQVGKIIFNTKARLFECRKNKVFLDSIINIKKEEPDNLHLFPLKTRSQAEILDPIQDDLERNDVNYELIALSIVAGAIDELTESDMEELEKRDIDNLNQQKEITKSAAGYIYRTQSGGLCKYNITPSLQVEAKVIGKWAYTDKKINL